MVYIKQLDKFSCAPVALINAFKWLGFNANRHLMPDLIRECKTGQGGTPPVSIIDGLEWLMDRFDVDWEAFDWRPKVTLYELNSELKLGNAVLLCYAWKDNKEYKGHIALFTKVSATGKTFTGINAVASNNGLPQKQSNIPRSFMKSILSHSDHIFPFALVTKPLHTLKSPLYQSQPDKISCSITAITNAFLWLGYPITNQDALELREICKTKHDGTSTYMAARGITHLCKKLNLPRRYFQWQSNLTVNRLDDLMESGNAMILQYCHQQGCHASFLPSCLSNGKWFEATNIIDEVLNRYVSHTHLTRSQIQNLLRIKNADDPSGWLVKKEAHAHVK